MQLRTKRILFDATILRFGLKPSCARSGIFVVASEVLAEMCRRQGLRVDLYVDSTAVMDVRAYLDSREDFRSLKIVNVLASGPSWRVWRWLQTNKTPEPEDRGGRAMKLVWLVYRVLWESSAIICSMFLCRAGRQQRRQFLNVLMPTYDAFFSPMYKAPPAIVRERIPRYTIIYDTIPQVFPDLYRNNIGVQWTQDLIDSLTAADWCFSISESTKRDFLRFSPRLQPDRVSVIPLAAGERFSPCHDPDLIGAVREKYGIPRGKSYFLSLCTLEPRKNLPFTMRAFAAFARSRPDCVLVLAGGSWAGYRDELESALAAVSDVRERILFPGYIEDKDLSALYSGATAFVYLSVYEGFGLPPLEAMQCGTPVVVSNTSSLPEVVGDAGILVLPTDLDAVVKALERVAEDGDFRKKLSERGLSRSRQFTWQRAVDGILSAIGKRTESFVGESKKLLFDATILRYGLQSNAARSGIYVASYEILRALQDRQDLTVDLWCPSQFVPDINVYLRQHPELSQVALCSTLVGDGGWAESVARLEGLVAPLESCDCAAGVRLLWLACLSVRWPLLRIARHMADRAHERSMLEFRQRYDGFFSPVFAAPKEIVETGLPRYTVLYDAIPMLFPQFYAHATEEMWTSVLARSLTEEDHCFAISECTKRDFLKFAPNLKAENVSVIPLAASERFYPCTDTDKIKSVLQKYKLPTGRRYFLSLCTIEPRKNLDTALKAFAEFAKNDTETIFVLAGGGWDAYNEKWQSILESVREVRDRIYLPGYIADDDLAPLYSGARAFVYLSIYEGFGLPPLEAMQCGCPVICSNTSSLPEVVGDAALTASPDDMSAVVSAMRRISSDGRLSGELRRLGLERARRFSWARAADIVELAMCKGKRNKRCRG